jgi:hypothetical protein
MWRELLPVLFDGAEDGVRFIGAGSLLDHRLPPTGLNIVFGAGASHRPAVDVHAAPQRWKIYGVRGPLSARLLGLPDKAVLTDPAVLVAGHARWQDRPAPATRALFVPRGPSARFGQWSAACALAGIDTLDPRADARTRVDRIAGSRLVITESLQAAVVADSLRVPWIPIVLSHEVALFSWADWAATMGVEYTPLLLVPSSPLEALRARLLAHSSRARIGAFHDQAQRGTGPRELAWTRAQLLDERSSALARAAQVWRRHCSTAADAALDVALRITPAAHECLLPDLYRRYRESAAQQLRMVLASPAQLSHDNAHRRALSRCSDALALLQADCRAGAFAGWAPAPPDVPGRLQARDFAMPYGDLT